MNIQKVARQDALLEIIRSERVSRQEQLVDLLNRQGFEVTQSSVSRDLDELGVVKAAGYYASPAALETPFGHVDISNAGQNLIVVRCRSGLASAVAVQIDAAGINDIVGTIAGDDTIFIAIKDADAQAHAVKKLWEVFSR